MIIFLVILTSVSAFNASAVNAQTNLRIAMVGSKDVHNDTLEPLPIWVEIVNPDLAGHFYKIRIDFQGSTMDQWGYVAAGDWDAVYFSVIPTAIGSATIRATLWQDTYDGGSGIDQKTKNVTIEKSYMQTQIEDLNDAVQNLQAENSRLSDVVNKLTYGIVSLIVLVFVVAFVVWWLDKRRLINATSNRS